MNVMIVDDEKIVLSMETAIVRKALPDAELASFKSAAEAIDYADTHQIDIAFLDINMKGITGLELAKALQERNAKVNIIFCTGYSEYALDAYNLYASAYLMKPINEAAIQKAVSQLRFPIAEKKRVSALCFGNFEVLCDGEPIKFKNSRTKELFAYLIDRKGALLSTNEIMAAMFGDEDKGSYMRNMKADLIATFQQLGIENVLSQQRKQIGIHTNEIDCDYYSYLDGRTDLFHGEYMTQYTFSEETLAKLLNQQ